MSEFNRMTTVAAAEVISDTHSHSDIDVLEVLQQHKPVMAQVYIASRDDADL